MTLLQKGLFCGDGLSVSLLREIFDFRSANSSDALQKRLCGGQKVNLLSVLQFRVYLQKVVFAVESSIIQQTIEIYSHVVHLTN